MNIVVRVAHVRHPAPPSVAVIARIAVGLMWLAGAAFNLLVTLRMANPFGWLADGSKVTAWRWFFGDVVETHLTWLWIALLIAGETALGVLTLARHGWARLGLAGGALFSVVLFSFGTSYTLMMGPYALLLAWLARYQYCRSVVDLLHGQHQHMATHRRR